MKGIDTRQFILNHDKPTWCKPVDILLIAVIIDLSDDEGKCHASQSTLGTLIGLNRDNVRPVISRLVEHGWLTETKRASSQQSNLLYPQLHNIPLGRSRPKVVSAESRRLAARYYEAIRALPKVMSKNGRMRASAYPHRGWPQHYSLVMQNWLDDGWTPEQVQKVVDYAFSHVGDKAKRGPQCIKPQFKTLAESAGIKK
jgi:helix-turn-helix protein